MKQLSDTKTIDMLGIKRGRGRPSTGLAISDAERSKNYRLRQKTKSFTLKTQLIAVQILIRYLKQELAKD